jgi:hypothetical protein
MQDITLKRSRAPGKSPLNDEFPSPFRAPAEPAATRLQTWQRGRRREALAVCPVDHRGDAGCHHVLWQRLATSGLDASGWIYRKTDLSRASGGCALAIAHPRAYARADTLADPCAGGGGGGYGNPNSDGDSRRVRP